MMKILEKYYININIEFVSIPFGLSHHGGNSNGIKTNPMQNFSTPEELQRVVLLLTLRQRKSQ
jgi:hypothetical protein